MLLIGRTAASLPPPRICRRSSSAANLASILLLALCCAACSQKIDPSPAPQTLAELEQRIRDVLEKTNTPGTGVALVSRDDVLWVADLGLADRAANRPVTPETIFRLGSISKSFVALSVLKLQEEGKLDLHDRLRDRAPEIAFTNPWEKTDPVRLEHLLEHTSGLGDFTLAEHAISNPSITLADALALQPQMRVVRTRPGSYSSYSNVGPAMAAYVVEKLTGRSYEDYVEQEFFAPLGMHSASFFLTERVQRDLSKSYSDNSPVELPYCHMIARPSGAISATPQDAARLVQRLLNRGQHAGTCLLQPESIERMETPLTSLAARSGLAVGDALGNYSTIDIDHGFVFHGHNGATDGFLSSYAYAPEHGVGYFFSINACSPEAFAQIGGLLRSYLLRDRQPVQPPAATISHSRLQELSGYYEPVTLPNFRLIRCFARLVGTVRISPRDGHLQIAELSGMVKDLIPVSDHAFRGKSDPVATAVFFEDDGDQILEGAGAAVHRRYRLVPTWRVWTEGSAAVICCLLMLSSVLFALVWVPRQLMGRLHNAGSLSVRLLPLLAVLCLFAAFALVSYPSGATLFIERFGKPTPWSIGLCILTALFPLLTLAGLVHSLRAPWFGVHRLVWIHALLVSAANLLVAAYLAYWGIIGWRTWV
jgi:CubicO group peptidase (beta-lactamase class C family)